MLMKTPVCLMMSSNICLIVEPSSELKLKIMIIVRNKTWCGRFKKPGKRALNQSVANLP
jgi:hypothetical protein